MTTPETSIEKQMDYLRCIVIESFRNINTKTCLDDAVVLKFDYGRKTRIGWCLSCGMQFNEDFRPTEMAEIDLAFNRLGMRRNSDRISECCSQMLEKLKRIG